MDIELLNKISTLNFQGYYDPSKQMVAVHFFNSQADKSDIIAFLNRDMSWDVREIISETSTLYADKEIIVVEHKSISTQPKGSDFDNFVRVGIESMDREFFGEEEKDLESKDIVLKILNNGYMDN